MPAYNAQDYIADAIRSVIQQTFTDFQLLIVNNGSTDNTLSIIKSFSDPRIKVVNQPEKGIAVALNTGLQHATSEYIARFDADDICYPRRLEEQYNFMVSHPDYIVCGSACDYMDMHGNYIFTYHPKGHTHEEIQKIKHNYCPFIHSSTMFKKESILQHGGYSENAHHFEDHILWLKILQYGKACNLSRPLIRVRLNPGSITIDEKWRHRKFTEIKQAALKKGDINATEGSRLLEILKQQDTQKIKEGAYYALLAKKFLWNNYQPENARRNLKKSLALNRFEWRTYGLFLISYLPEDLLFKLYHLLK
jgi:glycosyltransferase involved in cell wall biosynthesis